MSCPLLLIGVANVPEVTSGKSLGVHIDEALTWAAYIRGDLKEINHRNRSAKL